MPPKQFTPLDPSLESQRRRRLIQAVVECVSEEGFEGTTMRKIAERAGVSTGMLTYYFRSKKELVNAAMVSVFHNSESQIDEKAGSSFGPRRLKILLEQWFTSRDPELPSGSFMLRVRAAALAAPEVSEQLHASMVASRSKLERSIRAGIESSHYRSDLDPALAADLIYGLMNGWAIELAIHPEIEAEHGLKVTRLALQLLRKDGGRGGTQGRQSSQQDSEQRPNEETSTLDQIETALLSDERLTPGSARELNEVIRKMYTLVADRPILAPEPEPSRDS